MSKFDASLVFLKEAMKHFVCLTYRARPPDDPNATNPPMHYASCFIVEVEKHWFLVTAGHIANDLKRAVAKGYIVSDATLHDKLAGHSYPFGLPFHMEVSDWATIENDPAGTDYAALLLTSLTVQGLFSGGIRGMSEEIWGTETLAEYEHWLLVGIPSETHKVVRGQLVLKPTVMVLRPSERPPEALGPTGEKVFAQLVSQPEDQVRVGDIDGMSGGPIFGLRVVENRLRYWLVGVQSSWFKTSRVVGICPMLRFLLTLRKVVHVAQADRHIFFG
jgi:hypothetical protein